MAAFMGEGFVARAPMPVQRSARVVAPRPLAQVQAIPAPTATPAVAPVPASPQRANGSAHAPAPTAAPVAPQPVAPAAPAAPQPVAVKAEATEAAPRSNGAAKPGPGADAVLDRAKLTNMLLDIVEEKTGYPRDMVGLDQNLEADLGIDSIKRIEVVGAMLQALPEKQREALTAQRSKLNTQASLNGMLELLASNLDKAVAA